MPQIIKSSGERLRCSAVLFCDLCILRFAQDGRRKAKKTNLRSYFDLKLVKFMGF